MKQWSVAGATALFSVLAATGAQAQVTPEEVWQNWQKLGATYGQAIVADSVTREGDTLVVKGMKTSMNQDGASLSGSMDEIRFRDLGDGTVEVSVSDTYVSTITMPGENGTPEVLDITLSQPGLTMIASGGGTETAYAFDGPDVSISAQAKEGDKTLADISARMTGLTGAYLASQEGEISALDTELEAQTVAFTIKGTNDADTFDATGTMAAVRIATQGSFLGLAAMANMAQALKDGFVTDTGFSFGAGSFSIDVVEGGKPTKIDATAETGSFSAALSNEGILAGAGGTGVDITISGAEIPFPELKVSYGEASYEFSMPVSVTPEPAPFSFLTRIVDLTVSDEIWGIFDPTATLPRDPATIILDTTGTATLTNDLFDEAAMEAAGDAPPGQLNALDVTEVLARFAGAELTGKGSFTFDNSDLATYGGVPAPTGKIDLVLKGGNGLLDKLVAMGLIPQDQAMGARMMLAMVAKPGAGQDVLNSSLEFKDKGFYANGQRLQ